MKNTFSLDVADLISGGEVALDTECGTGGISIVKAKQPTVGLFQMILHDNDYRFSIYDDLFDFFLIKYIQNYQELL